MQTPTATAPAALRASRRTAAFTLTELLVAIGIVALLTLGIGQIFRSVSRIVGLGTAIAECDQIARTIERQLREDFEAFRALPPEQTLLAIRMREVGDVNRNGQLDSDERALYLSVEDRDFDLVNEIAPYTPGSRAVTRRVDDMIFLGQGSYDSYQLDTVKTQVGDIPRVVAVSAPHARIYWGHGLRPAPDPEWPPANPEDPAAPRAPNRQYYADGDFGQAATSSPNRFATNGAIVSTQGRNAYAGSWILARQQLLLFGGQAAGEPRQNRLVAVIGNGREYAPYARDLETRVRFSGGAITPDIERVITESGPRSVRSELWMPDRPEPRMLTWGRVDICAQSREDLQRWLEGEDAAYASLTSGEPPGSRPFSSGALADPNETDDGTFNNAINRFLWQRFAVGASGGQDAGSAAANLAANLSGLREAIAGLFFRPLVESEPPVVEREPRGGDAIRAQPADALMDVHALIASRCSNFEIAWTDRTVALDDIDFDGDGAPDVSQGDMIWFDITPIQIGSDPSNRRRSTALAWANWPGLPASETLPRVRRDDLDYGPVLDDLLASAPGVSPAFPEVHPVVGAPIDTWARNRQGLGTAGAGAVSGKYNPDIAGGAPLRGSPNFGAPILGGTQTEYLAIWPFRRPSSSGEFSDQLPISKNILVRVRFTIHDSQFRLADGRSYEFIFDLSPRLN